jgi:hypothetical protein
VRPARDILYIEPVFRMLGVANGHCGHSACNQSEVRHPQMSRMPLLGGAGLRPKVVLVVARLVAVGILWPMNAMAEVAKAFRFSGS